MNIFIKPEQYNANGPFSLTSLILQLVPCYGQLMIIVGLCSDGGKSFTSTFFQTNPLQVSIPQPNNFIMNNQH
jgi:hypothetical protein